MDAARATVNCKDVCGMWWYAPRPPADLIESVCARVAGEVYKKKIGSVYRSVYCTYICILTCYTTLSSINTSRLYTSPACGGAQAHITHLALPCLTKRESDRKKH